jgi:ABC-type transport system involved in multi-copper enzyme maturation permease subunit
MRQILAIAKNTFREAIRDRIFHSLFVFSVLILFSSLILGYVTVGERARIVMNVGMASIHLFGVLIAITVGTGLVYKEMAKRTIVTLLSKPLARHQFLLGKYLGLGVVLAVQLVLMTAVFQALFSTVGGWTSVLIYQAVFLMFVELMVITAVVLLLSTVTSPFTGGILSGLFFLMGHSIGELQKYTITYAAHTANPAWRVAFAIFPDLERFNLKENALYGISVSWGFIGQSVAYGALLSAVFVIGATVVFQRRDFT